MRLSVIAYLLGNLLIVLGFAKCIPLVWAILYQEDTVIPFLISIVASLLIGLLLKVKMTSKGDISIKESFAFVSLCWIISALFGALPFYLSGSLPSFVDSFFEAMSGFTTTGATVVINIEALPQSILFWRSFTHWLGGMGIIALFVAIMPQLGVRGMNLLKAEVPGPTAERIVPRVAETAKILWIIYCVISAVETVLLLLAGLSFFDALTHTFATMATGGFSTKNASIQGFYSVKVEVIIIIFMFIAGGNFSLYYALTKRNYRAIFHNEEFRFYTGMVLFCILVIFFTLFFNDRDFFMSLRKSTFQVLSIVTTTGFTTTDFDAWPQLARGLLFFTLFVGGCGGSTAGAMKQIRILVLLKYGYRELYKLLHPRAVIPLRINKTVLSDDIVASIMAFMSLYLFIFVIASLLMTAFGIDLISSFSAVAATLGNVGPGLGLVGPLHTYSFIPDKGKILLTLMMLLGRLEIYTVLVLILPEFRKTRNWFKV